MKYPQRIKVMNTYLVELISDLDEQVSIYVDAYDESEAEAIGVTMLEMVSSTVLFSLSSV